jgi:tetratricopeptide (TPR) repeat protein
LRHRHDDKAHGWWQFVVFGLSLVVAFFVYIHWPEPEESVRGYTPAGCHKQAKELFRRARGRRDVRSRSELYASSVKYIEALEERFGIKPARWDAYEMLGDAYRELAATAESEREIARRFRLKPPPVAHAEALRAYRAAAARLDVDAPERPRLLRKTTEMLLTLDRPDEALGVLRGLMKLYRRDKIDRLRRERGEDVARRGGVDARASGAPGRGDEALRAYFLAGSAALAVARKIEARPGFTLDSEAQAEAAASRQEAGSAFSVFLDSGGAGERRATAETALGDLAFARAAAEPENTDALLRVAAGHFRAAGTPEAEFLRARALFAMGDCESALRIFRRSSGAVPGAERRARRYMEGRCLLALGRIDDSEDDRSGKIEGARSVFTGIRADEKEDADGVASLVMLADIALDAGDLDQAAAFLLEVAALRGRARGGMPLPERDRELEAGRLTGKLVSLAEAFEQRGDLVRAVEVYGETRKLARDPARHEMLLRRIARAWQRKASDLAAQGDDDGARAAHTSAAHTSAADACVALADVLSDRNAQREALAGAASLYAAGGVRARAVEVARRVVRDWPKDPATPRMLHDLATWEAQLGLTEKALAHFEENVTRHWSDVHADRSLVAFVEMLGERGGEADLARAREILQRVLYKDTPLRTRYAAGTFVRLWALFALGRVDVRLADHIQDGDADAERRSERKQILNEAIGVLGKALDEEPDSYPKTGKGARPSFRELIDRERPGAFLLRGRARGGLASLESNDAARRALYASAAADLGKADAAQGDAGLHLALVECRRAVDDAARWNSARAAIERLRVAAGTDKGILSASDWQSWSEWVSQRGKEGSTDGGAD